jgi:hypothetical protein
MAAEWWRRLKRSSKLATTFTASAVWLGRLIVVLLGHAAAQLWCTSTACYRLLIVANVVFVVILVRVGQSAEPCGWHPQSDVPYAGMIPYCSVWSIRLHHAHDEAGVSLIANTWWFCRPLPWSPEQSCCFSRWMLIMLRCRSMAASASRLQSLCNQPKGCALHVRF